MFNSSYSTEQQVRQELAQRRHQAAQARLAHQAQGTGRPDRRQPARLVRLLQRLALLLVTRA